MSAANGLFDLVFNEQTYPSIPVDISTVDLTNRLQLSFDFGFLNITRSRDCTGYSYRTEWLSNGGQKSSISITHADSILPSGTTVIASVVQSGGALYKPLPGDMTRTYHTNPQIEVFVGGYPSQCTSSNTCDFQWLTTQTPSVSSIVQSDITSLSVGDTSCVMASFSQTLITCTVGSSPAGRQSVVSYVISTGKSNSDIEFQYTLQVNSATPSRGSYGGGQTIIILGDGFNGSTVGVTICSQTCQSVVVVSNTQLTCVTPLVTISLLYTTCSLTVSVGSSTQSISYIYEASLTATIISVSPSRGGTCGGTTLTILGTNFP